MKDKEMLEKIYNNEYHVMIILEHINGKITFPFNHNVSTFNVECYNDDCRVGNFGVNFYFRTPHGINSERYKSLEVMRNSINSAANRYGLHVIALIVTDGYVGDYIRLTELNFIVSIDAHGNRCTDPNYVKEIVRSIREIDYN